LKVGCAEARRLTVSSNSLMRLLCRRARSLFVRFMVVLIISLAPVVKALSASFMTSATYPNPVPHHPHPIGDRRRRADRSHTRDSKKGVMLRRERLIKASPEIFPAL
jgi:hypothetical protein